jgi:hypothetical protein
MKKPLLSQAVNVLDISAHAVPDYLQQTVEAVQVIDHTPRTAAINQGN